MSPSHHDPHADCAPAQVDRRSAAAALLSNVSWLVLERVVVMAVGFAVNVWFVRYLGAERYGSYSYAASFSTLFTAVGGLGLDTILVRDLALHPSREAEVLGTALRVRVVASVLMWILAICVSAAWRGSAGVTWLVAILSAGNAVMVASVYEFWFQARVEARPVVLARMGGAVGGHVARALLIAAGGVLNAFAAVQAAAIAAPVLLMGWAYRRRSSVRWTVSGRLTISLLREAWPLIVVSLSIMVYMKIDQVMLAAMVGNAENGIYATAVTISEVWYFLPLAVASSAFPLLLRKRQSEGEARYAQWLQVYFDAAAALGYAIAVPVFALSGVLIERLYGAQYARSGDVLRVHILSLVFVCLGVARSRILIAERLTIFSMAATIAAAGLNVLFNLVLIPRYGALGAAWSTLISYASANYASGIFAPRVRGITLMMTRALCVPLRPRQLARAVMHGIKQPRAV